MQNYELGHQVDLILKILKDSVKRLYFGSQYDARETLAHFIFIFFKLNDKSWMMTILRRYLSGVISCNGDSLPI